VNVRWTQNALEQLSASHYYVAKNSPRFAVRVVDRLTRRSEQLASFPNLGQMVPEYNAPDIREVYETPYRLIYRVAPNEIEILAVIHGARPLPPVP
jgi:toxin ParE1/3/4